jgi:hypothetical protein
MPDGQRTLSFLRFDCMPDGQKTFRLHAFSRFDCTPFHASTAGCMPDGQRTSRLHAFSRFDCTPFHASTSGCMPDGRRTLTLFRFPKIFRMPDGPRFFACRTAQVFSHAGRPTRFVLSVMFQVFP